MSASMYLRFRGPGTYSAPCPRTPKIHVLIGAFDFQGSGDKELRLGRTHGGHASIRPARGCKGKGVQARVVSLVWARASARRGMSASMYLRR